MINQLSWKVGGQQGEGIEKPGDIFATALNRLGYYLYGYRQFSSRIKGGHTNNKIRVSTKPLRAVSDDLDILLAFDQETIDLNSKELNEKGIVLADAKFNPTLPEGVNARLFAVPFTKISEELGSTLMKNMVAVGASLAVLNLPLDPFKEVVEELWGRKGQAVVEKNMEAINKGVQFMREAGGDFPEFQLEPADGKKRMFMIGNDAVALGAMAAGVRFMPAYPITPASEIMEYLIKHLPKFGGTVIQTEDEIAAIVMAIGSNYGGARAFTASAGPGLSLMMEAIGLAGMTETPVVVVNTQRGGPSTGLPTKQEQSDLNAMIQGTHGEIPKVVIAPSTVEECFYDMAEAFNIAEEYQCPVILLIDLSLALGKQTVEPLDYDRIEIRRGKLIKDQELPQLGEDEHFKRYEVTEDGISPRPVPGQKNGLHYVTGNEHSVIGRPFEGAPNRRAMTEKRLRKLDTLVAKFPDPIIFDGDADAETLVIGFNSSLGTITEGLTRLEKEGHKFNHAQIRLIAPFPTEVLKPAFDKAKTVIVVENNATGQLADQILLHLGGHDKVKKVLKYDGNPFLPAEIYKQVKELI